MTQKERQVALDHIWERINIIFDTKGIDYAGREDVLSNFKDEAEKLGLNKYQILMVYKNKHETAICNAIKDFSNDPGARSPERKGETLKESVMDSIVYGMLLYFMLMEENDSPTE